MRVYFPNRRHLGMCQVLAINYEEKRYTVSNGILRLFPSFDEVIEMKNSECHDINNKQIYQHDIVEVETDSGKIISIVLYGYTKFYIEKLNHMSLYEVISKYKVTIIGNKHINKDLLSNINGGERYV